MSAIDFLDTNILVYSYDIVDLRKQGIAQNFVDQALDGAFIISQQVLAEFASTLLDKMAPAITQLVLRESSTRSAPFAQSGPTRAWFGEQSKPRKPTASIFTTALLLRRQNALVPRRSRQRTSMLGRSTLASPCAILFRIRLADQFPDVLNSRVS